MSTKARVKNDVFLSHNSKDKTTVRELKRRLIEKGVSVWLDEDELQPGLPWQKLLEIGIKSSKSVVVVVGSDGLGPWEDEEMQGALRLAVKGKRPVIPVLMPNARTQPKLPMFLGNRTWVRLGDPVDEAAIDRLIWGITGNKPVAVDPPQKVKPSDLQRWRQVSCVLKCVEKASDTLHGRNASFLCALCNKFPNTEFRLTKEGALGPLGKPANMRSPIDMMLSAFHDGDTVILETSGEFERMAAQLMKVALENLTGYSDDPMTTRKRIAAASDVVSERLYDPDLEELNDIAASKCYSEPLSNSDEYRCIAVINDRLHDVSLPVIPLVAKLCGSTLHIGFELPSDGVFMFDLSGPDDLIAFRRILALDIPVATKVTIVTRGGCCEDAGLAIRDILQNLWQCDQWIRQRAKDWDSDAAVHDLVGYAREMAKHYSSAYSHVQNPFISNLISQSVFVNDPGSGFTKALALEQLVAPHARLYGLPSAEILRRVEENESKQTVAPRPGFAIAHAAMDRSPRISISFGTYPDGLLWSDEDGIVNLVAMVICAQDTYKTWRDYRKRFAILFREVPDLQSRLLLARTSRDFRDVFRTAETSLSIK